MHRCSAACCDNKEYTYKKSKECLEDCAVKVNWAQSYLRSEVEELRKQFEGCLTNCNDIINKELSHDPSQEEVIEGIFKYI